MVGLGSVNWESPSFRAGSSQSLGPRAVGELLAEIGREHAIRTAIEQKLERYARLTPEQIGTVGGEDFPPAPLRVVGGDE